MLVELGPNRFLKLDLMPNKTVVMSIQCESADAAKALYDDIRNGCRSGSFIMHMETTKLPNNG